LGLYADGKIAPVVSATYPLQDAKVALDALGARKTKGKVVLIP
jgi:NADPH:quinone reductase-like Zn-dependent oxidoreductase